MSQRALKSTQRELNPHLRHGKAMRFRYAMSAGISGRIVKEQFQTVRTESSDASFESALPVGMAEVGPDGLEPSPARLRAGCAASNTLIPFHAR